MSTENVADVFKDGILVVLRVGGPILILCMVVGVVVAILQAVTQIHEQSIAFLLKLIVVVVVLLIGGGWMLRLLQEYTIEIFNQML